MKINANVSIAPVHVSIEVPDGMPLVEIRDLVIGQARAMLASNGSEHVVLASSHDTLVDSIPYLNDLGFPVLVERVIIQPPEPDWSELAEYGCMRTRDRNPDEDQYATGLGDWPD